MIGVTPLPRNWLPTGKRGLVTRGLVGMWGFGGDGGAWYEPRRNLLKYPEAFDNAVWAKTQGGTGSVPVITANAGTDPLGGATADRAQFALNGGTTTADFSVLQQTAAGLDNPHDGTMSVWMKTNSGGPYLVLMRSSGAGTQELKTITSEWQRFTFSVSAAAATFDSLDVRLRGAQGTSDSADILIWGGMWNEGASVLVYADNSYSPDLQLLKNFNANGPAGQRGSAAGTDVNDPIPRANFWSFDGSNDYFAVADSALTSIVGDLTIVAVVNPTSFAAARNIISKGAAGEYDLQLGTDGKPVLTRNAVSTGAGATALSAGAWSILIASARGTAVNFWVNGVKTTGFTTGTPTDSATAVRIGQRTSGVNPFLGGIASLFLYSTAFSDPEAVREYKYIKNVLNAQRGLAIP